MSVRVKATRAADRGPRTTSSSAMSYRKDGTQQTSNSSSASWRLARRAGPGEAQQVVSELTRAGELVELGGGRWTARKLRELELRTLDRVADPANSETPGTSAAVALARESARRQIDGPDARPAGRTRDDRGSGERRRAGRPGTYGQRRRDRGGPRGVEHDGHRVVGTAVAGATAKRLGGDAGSRDRGDDDDGRAHDSPPQWPARTRRAFGHRRRRAGMAGTRRLAKVVEAASESRAKLVLVGDAAQLSPIGAGGLFAELVKRSPSAELTSGPPRTGGLGAQGMGAAPRRRSWHGARPLRESRSPAHRRHATRELRLVSGWSTTGRGPARRTRPGGS
jgi:hypothetical protein